MVLTDKQRTDLHGGIHAYLLSRGERFAAAAAALADADPDACASSPDGGTDGPSSAAAAPRSGSSSAATLLEKKWTAVPRLQRRVLELERQAAASSRRSGHRGGNDENTATGGRPGAGGRRMLPRPGASTPLKSHSSAVTSASVHPDYTLAASGSDDGTVKLWDHESGEYLRTLKGHTNAVTCVDFSPSGGYLASSSADLSVKIWSVGDGEYACVRTLRGHDHTVSAVRFVPPEVGDVFLDGGRGKATGADAGAGGGGGGGVDLAGCGSRFVVTASRDQTVKFWDLTTGFCDATVSDHTDWVRCIAVRSACEAPKGGAAADSSSSDAGSGDASYRLALVAASGNDRTIRVFDAHGKRDKVCELRGHDHVVESLSFLCSSALPTAAGKGGKGTGSSRDRLASASRDRTVRLWSVSAGGSCLATFGGHENWVRGVVLHPTGDFVISCGDDRTVRVFDVKGGRCLRTIEDAHPHFVTCLAMHWTMPVLVTGGVDNIVRCWQLD